MKRALITGATGAIGASICKTLASNGFFVYVHSNLNPDIAGKISEDINNNGGFSSPVNFDVTDYEICKSALGNILCDGPIQVLINNAGIHSDAPMAGMDYNQWRSVTDVTLQGFYNITQPLLLPMMSTRWGRIISISSVAAITGNRGQVNYSAAKSGLHGASKSLAIELASRGVTVNVVAPGIIDSPMIEKSFSQEKINQIVPMKRAGKPEEVAALVNFLSSDSAGYISGQIISINGAMA